MLAALPLPVRLSEQRAAVVVVMDRTDGERNKYPIIYFQSLYSTQVRPGQNRINSGRP